MTAEDVGAVALVSHLYVGSRCLWIEGAVPGAIVSVIAQVPLPSRANGQIRIGGAAFRTITLGSAEASYRGAARVTLSQAVGSEDVIFLQQTAAGFPGPLTQQPPPDSTHFRDVLHGSSPLPAPRIVAPILAGQPAVRVEGILEGATVTLGTVGAGAVTTQLVDRTGVWLPVPDGAASAGDAYWVSQAFPAVAAASGRSVAVAVSAGPPPPPVIVGPVCAGDPFVLLTNLTYGAIVQLTVNGGVVGMAAAPATTYAFPLNWSDDLGTPAAGDASTVGTISAQQQLASGGWSVAASQDIQGGGYVNNFTEGPTLTPELNEGGRALHMQSATPGLTVWVQSKKWGVIGQAKSASPWITDGEGDIPIAPALVAGDTLSFLAYPATTSSPSTTPHFTSNTATVFGGRTASGQQLIALAPPIIASGIVVLNNEVQVTNVMPGADVDVYALTATGEFYFGTALATLSEVGVLPTGVVRLQPGDQLRARQRLGTFRTSDFGDYTLFEQAGADPVLASAYPTTVGCSIAGTEAPAFSALSKGQGTDLGVSTDVVHKGQTVTLFFFGDTAISAPQVKPVGYTTDDAPADPGPCLSMQYLVGPGPGHVLKGVSAPGFNLGSGFNVPTGAFTFGPYVYLFVMTSLNSSTNPSGAQGQSLLLRAASESLFSSAGTTLAFDNKSTISSSQGAVGYKFLGVSPTVITNSDYPLATATSAGLPAMAGNYAQGVLMFGSGPYRGNAGISNLSLAWMPLDDSGPHPELRARERRSRPVNAARGAV